MSIRVLVVDDAPFIRELLIQLLTENGIKVVGEAVDGDHAIEMAVATRPDVILMDLVMPNKSGVDATREILAVLPEVKIVACSTVDQQTMVLRALDAGCCEFVVKPFNSEQLLKVVRNSIKGMKEL